MESTTKRNSPYLAATKIQSTYRAHVIRSLYKTVASVDAEAGRLQRVIQQQDTVDALRSSERERLRINESLMSLLLRLDSVSAPGGIDPAVRAARRKVSRRIVGLQEIVDAICSSSRDFLWSEFEEENKKGYYGCCWDWQEQEDDSNMCRGGEEELERFCAQYFGFRCLDTSLR